MKPYNFMWLPRRHSPHRALDPNGVPGSAGEAAGAAAPGLGRIEAWKVPLFSLLPAMAGGKHGPGMLKFGHVKELYMDPHVPGTGEGAGRLGKPPD